jgi:ABC-2 type transport system ATP-binding protein
VLVETPEPAALLELLARRGLVAEANAEQVVVRGTTKTEVSELAFEHGIRLVELRDITQSLEDSLLAITRASAEFTAA